MKYEAESNFIKLPRNVQPASVTLLWLFTVIKLFQKSPNIQSQVCKTSIYRSLKRITFIIEAPVINFTDF